MLVSNEASREWVYTAMSRGRHANRLYALETEPDERLEIAPSDGLRTRDVLGAVMGRSTAQTLATDLPTTTARQLADAVRERQAAERAVAGATRERRALEEDRPGPLRHRARTRHRGALAAAYRVENAARARAELWQQREAELRERGEPRPTERDVVRAVGRRRLLGRGGIER